MQAFAAFEKTMQRVDRLVALHRRAHEGHGPGRPREEMFDVLRGALVLAVAALDALVLDCILEAIPALAVQGQLGGQVAGDMKDKIDALLQCFAQDNPSEALAEVCREKYGFMTFQSPKEIEGKLRGSLSCEAPWILAAKRLSESTWEEPSMRQRAWSSQAVTEQLSEYVKRRHRIAHDGDRAPGSPRTSPIRRHYVADAATFLRNVGRTISEVVDERVSN